MNQRERTEWHRVVIFNEQLWPECSRAISHAKAAQSILKASLQTRKWTDQQGVEKYTTEVVLATLSRRELTMLGRRQEVDAGGGDWQLVHLLPHRAVSVQAAAK